MSKAPNADQPWMSRNQAAAHLGVTPEWISILVRNNQLPAHRVGTAPNSALRFAIADVEALLHSNHPTGRKAGARDVSTPETRQLIQDHGVYLSVPQAAELVAVSAKTITRMIQRGELHAYQVGKSRIVRVKTADVLDLVRQVA